jgi:hypothetical protein
MADIQRLYIHRTADEVVLLLAQASLFAQKKPKINWYDIQNELKVGAEEANIIFDWLADKNEAEPHISNHWIRCGRSYALNNPFPGLTGMASALRVGERRAFLIMKALEKKGLFSIRSDFTFELKRRMSTFKDLVRQMERIAKKYCGRCEPQLLIRTLFIDPMTATRLAQYGEENLGLRWKGRPRELR